MDETAAYCGRYSVGLGLEMASIKVLDKNQIMGPIATSSLSRSDSGG